MDMRDSRAAAIELRAEPEPAADPAHHLDGEVSLGPPQGLTAARRNNDIRKRCLIALQHLASFNCYLYCTP